MARGPRAGFTRETSSNSIDVIGGAEIVAMLQSLPQKLALQLERKGLKRALEPTLHAAVAKAPVGATGKLANSIKLRTRTRKGRVTAQVYADDNKAHLLEYGHTIRSVKNGPIFGFVPPYPFMRPALDQTQNQAITILGQELQAELAKLEVPE